MNPIGHSSAIFHVGRRENFEKCFNQGRSHRKLPCNYQIKLLSVTAAAIPAIVPITSPTSELSRCLGIDRGWLFR